MSSVTGSFNLKETEFKLLRAVLTQVGDAVDSKILGDELDCTPNAASKRWKRLKDRVLGDINAAVAHGKDGVRKGSMAEDNAKTPTMMSSFGDAGKSGKRARDELDGYEADSTSSPKVIKKIAKRGLGKKAKDDYYGGNEALQRALNEEPEDAE